MGLLKSIKFHNLVYFEETNDVQIAISREKKLKTWKRSWKLELIENTNPGWKDLSEEL